MLWSNSRSIGVIVVVVVVVLLLLLLGCCITSGPSGTLDQVIEGAGVLPPRTHYIRMIIIIISSSSNIYGSSS